MKDQELVNALRCTSSPGEPIGDCKKCRFYKTEPVPEDLVGKVDLTEWSSCDVDAIGFAAADRIANQSTHIAALQQEIEKLRGQLKANEDTGLTPQEVLSMKFEWCAMMDALNSIGGGYTRLRDLAKADRDGRVVVLPCKVGDTLWVTGRDNVPREMELEAPDIRTVCTDEDNLCMSTCNRKPDGFCAYRLRNDGADIGKTVFLTREEAERALEGKRNA